MTAFTSCKPSLVVRCSPAQPTLVLLTSYRAVVSNPTLSYTQRLERRIVELEEQLANSSRSPGSAPVSAHSSPSTVSTGIHDGRSPPKSNQDDQSFSRSFSSLRVDDKGRITYNSPTERNAIPNTNGVYTSAELDQSIRERLVANAMQQRALETFSGTPVRNDQFYDYHYIHHHRPC